MEILESLLAMILGPIGMQELLIVLVIAVLIFGGKKIPELGRGLGDGIRQFKSSLKGEDEDPATAKADDAAKGS